jgi:hypothetical protein
VMRFSGLTAPISRSEQPDKSGAAADATVAAVRSDSI